MYKNPSTINEITPPNILRRPQIFKASITNGYVKTIDTFDDGNCIFFLDWCLNVWRISDWLEQGVQE